MKPEKSKAGKKRKAEDSAEDERKPKKEKKEKKEKPIVEEVDEADKWWEGSEEDLPDGVRWKSLIHNGLLFPPAYEPHGVKMLYDGE